jgi:ParB family chromosome partitioning protein
MSSEVVHEETQNTPSTDAGSDAAASVFSYRGSVSGLKGLLTSTLNQGLGHVVSTLEKVAELATSTDANASVTQPIAIEDIYPCPDQPRQVFDPKALEELSQTMQEVGQAQAITVRKTAQGYEIISGERRYRAAKLAGIKALDCVVKNCTASEGRLLALVENVQRQDLLPIEESNFLKKVLKENPEMSLEKLARVLGSHKSTLSEKIQLTEIPEDMQNQLFAKGRHFTHRHWRVISRIPDEAVRRNMLIQALEHHLSVAELERSVSALGVTKALRRSKVKGESSDQLSFEKLQIVRKDGDTFRIRAMTLDPAKLSGDARVRLIGELEDLLGTLKSGQDHQVS